MKKAKENSEEEAVYEKFSISIERERGRRSKHEKVCRWVEKLEGDLSSQKKFCLLFLQLASGKD